MKKVGVRVVESLSEEIEQIRSAIRALAHEKSLARGGEYDPDAALQDWLSAEREIVTVLPAKVSEQENGIVVELDIPEVRATGLDIQVTPREMIVYAAAGSREGTVDAPALATIPLTRAIDPEGIRASYDQDILKLTMPDGARMLKQSA